MKEEEDVFSPEARDFVQKLGLVSSRSSLSNAYLKELKPAKDSITVRVDREYCCLNLLYDTNGCRGFLKKYPERAGIFEQMTGRTYMRYFMLDLK